MGLSRLICLSILSLMFRHISGAVARSEDDHDHDGDHDHDHGNETHPWEWVGVFKLWPNETHTISLERGHNPGHSYANNTMRAVVYPVEDEHAHGVEDVEGLAHDLWETAGQTKLQTGGRLDINSSGLAFEFQVDQRSWISLYFISAGDLQPGAEHYAFFLEHPASEFEDKLTFMSDLYGHGMKPVLVIGDDHDHDDHDHDDHDDDDHDDDDHDHDDHDDDDHDDGKEGEGVGILMAILGSFLTTVPSTLLILVLGALSLSLGSQILPRIVPFASGVLAGVACFIILPEALPLAISSLGESWGAITWGGSILVGWLGCIFIHSSSGGSHNHSVRDVETSQTAMEMSGSPSQQGLRPADNDDVVAVERENLSVAFPVLFADATHGLVDGLVLAFAAKACSASLFWSIVLATLGHEFFQEISTFIVLTSQAKMSWVKAMVWNFLAAQTVIVGVLIGYFAEVPVAVEAVVLAMSSGVFLFVAFSDLLPHAIEGYNRNEISALTIIIGFCLGALSMTFFAGHVHCSAGHDHGAHGDHEGHDH